MLHWKQAAARSIAPQGMAGEVAGHSEHRAGKDPNDWGLPRRRSHKTRSKCMAQADITDPVTALCYRRCRRTSERSWGPRGKHPSKRNCCMVAMRGSRLSCSRLCSCCTEEASTLGVDTGAGGWAQRSPGHGQRAGQLQEQHSLHMLLHSADTRFYTLPPRSTVC